MCNFVSAVYTKDRLFFGPADSHSDIVNYHKLHETGARGVNLVKVELIPPKLSDPIAKWNFVVDQDLLPEWWEDDASVREQRMRAAVRRSGIRKAYADYEAKRAALDADCRAKRAALYADYEAKCTSLHADYRAKRAALHADFEAKCTSLHADYRAKRAALDADYRAKCAPLYADYEAKRIKISQRAW